MKKIFEDTGEEKKKKLTEYFCSTPLPPLKEKEKSIAIRDFNF